MQSRTSRSLAVLAAVLSVLALMVGACSNDADTGDAASKKEPSAKSTETTKSDDSKDSGEEADTSEAPGASPDFSKTVTAARKAIDGAEDACGLYEAVSALSTVGNPETKDQTREAVDFYVAMLNKMADTSSDKADAEVLRNGAADFEAFAKKVDYEPGKMNLSSTGPDIKDADKLDEAMNSYANTEFSKCQSSEGQAPQVQVPEGQAPQGDNSGN